MENTPNRLTPSEETALFLSQGFVFRTPDIESLARLYGMDKSVVISWYGELATILKLVPYEVINTATNIILVGQKICYQAEHSLDGKVYFDYQTNVHLSRLLNVLMNSGDQHLVEQILSALNWAWYQYLADHPQE